jgi:hypothetical protein
MKQAPEKVSFSTPVIIHSEHEMATGNLPVLWKRIRKVFTASDGSCQRIIDDTSIGRAPVRCCLTEERRVRDLRSIAGQNGQHNANN